MALSTKGIVSSFIAVLIGVILTPTIYSEANSANVSGTTQTILLVVPILFVVAVVYSAVTGAI